MKSIGAIVLIGIMSSPVLAGDDQWLAATAAARELANQLDYLQRALSTAPSGRLRTQPCTPSSRAASSAKNRKPTPCTRPLSTSRRATSIDTV